MNIFIFNSDEYQDYLADLVNSFFFNSSNKIFTNYAPPFLFDDFQNIEKLYGKGFTLYGKLSRDLKKDINIVSETNIMDFLKDTDIDLFIFSSIRRSFAGKSIWKDYFKNISSILSKDKIISIDGEDDNIVIEVITKYSKYFKRELLPEYSKIAFPISFSFPSHFSNIKNHNISEKTNILAPMDPRFSNSYIFDEESYFKQYADSLFGTTTKKNGWDCLRHYEIIASGCLPYFPDINEKPKTIMENYPVLLQNKVNQLFEKIILSSENIDSLKTISSKTRTNTLKKATKKLSKLNIISNNLKTLEIYNRDFQEWFENHGKSSIYRNLLN